MNTESEFVAHEPCPNCGSSDANSRYSDGHTFCFSCQTYTPADGDNPPTHKISYVIQHHYNPDFILPNGIYLETKGFWDAADRRKILAVVRDNPDIDLRMVFQAPFNKISKKSKTTYAQWCEKHGIKWAAVHAIPIDWLT